jgi:intracellular multiplication protein IcmB
LSTYTKFDIGESRITIFDLDQVVKGNGLAGGKQSAVMLALSFHTLTKDFMLHPDDVDMYPTLYREYQYGRALASQREMKTVTVDEFHRISVDFAGTIRNQFKVIGREGRKWKIALNLGSQSLAHFDSELIDLATGLYIMDRPDGNLLKDYKERFNLSDTECAALTEHVHGPRAGGGTFFARMKLKEGYYIQLLRNPAGPIELWALTSTLEDKAVRSLVYAALGAVDGRSALASTYPGGSAAKDIEQRKVNLALRGESLINGAEDDLYTQVANEVISSFRKLRAEETRKEIAEQQFRKQMAEKRATA